MRGVVLSLTLLVSHAVAQSTSVATGKWSDSLDVIKEEFTPWVSEISADMMPGASIPEVAVIGGNKVAGPYVADKKIYFPLIWGMYVRSLPVLLAHDIYVKFYRSNDLDFPLEVLPYDKSPIIASLGPMQRSNFLESWNNMKDLLSCPAEPECAKQFGQSGCPVNPPCKIILEACQLAFLDFIFAHELAHFKLGHNQREVKLEDEIAADREAWAFVQRTLHTPSPGPGTHDTQTLVSAFRLAISAAPLLVIELSISGTTEGESLEWLQKRRAALYSLVSSDLSAQIRNLVQPEISSTLLGTLTVRLSQPPDWLFLDGMGLSAQELRRHNLLVPFGSHQIFARRGKMFAFASFFVDPHHQDVSLELRFRLLKSCTNLELTSAIANKHWFDSFLCVSNERMESRSSTQEANFRTALRELGLSLQRDVAGSALPFNGYLPRRDEALASWGTIDELTRNLDNVVH